MRLIYLFCFYFLVCDNSKRKRPKDDKNLGGKKIFAFFLGSTLHLSRSPKRSHALESIYSMFNPGARHRLRMIPFHTIRWMGRKNSVAKIIEGLKELLTYSVNSATSELPIEIDWVKFSTSFFSFTTPLKNKNKTLTSKS